MKSTLKGIAGLLFFVSISSTAVFAQVNQNQQAQTQQKEISQEELENFAQAFQAMRLMNQQVQQEMAGLVENEGMEIKRFNEIHQATVDPQQEVEATSEEKKQYKAITSEIEKRQASFQGKMEKLITDEEMTLKRYEEIATQLQNDPELQERLRAVFQQ